VVADADGRRTERAGDVQGRLQGWAGLPSHSTSIATQRNARPPRRRQRQRREARRPVQLLRRLRQPAVPGRPALLLAAVTNRRNLLDVSFVHAFHLRSVDLEKKLIKTFKRTAGFTVRFTPLFVR